MNGRASSDQKISRRFVWRSRIATAALVICAAVLVARSFQLQVLHNGFLTREGDERHLRIAKIAAHRGVIRDRNGEALAVSTPVDSVWVNPKKIVAEAPESIPQLASALGTDSEDLKRRLTQNVDKEFLYLRRHMAPSDAETIARMRIPGVELEREYKRYYPAGEVIGHLVGFTNIDDRGQEGLELAFDHWLAGKPGKKRVLKDRLGRIVEDVERIESPSPGRHLTASIDLRIQYLAYRELKAATQRNHAKSGSVVVLDVTTGEVLAAVNQPSYNPNDRSQFSAAKYRNRVFTDIFEPGSSIKPLIIAAALESGSYNSSSLVDTRPITIGDKVIEDKHYLGRIDLQTILVRSSNVGATRVAMSLPPESLFSTLSDFGMGRLTGSGFPGESAGLLSHYSNWRQISQATLAYGYGLSVTPLQLAQAYSVIAAGGVQRPIALLRVDDAPISRRVIQAKTSAAVLSMLENVVGPNGTGQRAAVAGYRIGGKTGTVKKFAPGGYSEKSYTALFAGVAPVSAPRLAVVVVVDEPSDGHYYGGDVAAPVFSRIITDAMRILAIPPDGLPNASKPGKTMIAKR
jgi:cell division protein FtsI (penicillin-binding protein 3)